MLESPKPCKSCFELIPVSSPEAALLLISTKNHDLWPSPTLEVRDSRTSPHSGHTQSQVISHGLSVFANYHDGNAASGNNPCRQLLPGTVTLKGDQRRNK